MRNKLLKSSLLFHVDYTFTYTEQVPYVAYKVIFKNLDKFKTWHDRLGHRGIYIMRKSISNYVGHNLPIKDLPSHQILYANPMLT